MRLQDAYRVLLGRLTPGKMLGSGLEEISREKRGELVFYLLCRAANRTAAAPSPASIPRNGAGVAAEFSDCCPAGGWTEGC